jgi:SAM-dependent methyltransferase
MLSAWDILAYQTDQRHRSGACDDDEWYAIKAALFSDAYLGGRTPRAQSGFGGDARRWEHSRRPIAATIDRPGSFLDIGCANGHLLECFLSWCRFRIEPFGLDFVPALVELARARLERWAHQIYLGNAISWTPPCRFDFVRVELTFVPTPSRRAFVDRLLSDVVTPGGSLIVCSYGNPAAGINPSAVGARLVDLGHDAALEFDVIDPDARGVITRVAVVRN